MNDSIRSQFNLLLVRHLERLTGSPNAVGGLSYSLDNIGPLILFGGREIEMSDIYSEVADRYSMDEFLKEAKDAGIEQDENFQAALQEMIERKYIDPRPDGLIHGYQDSKDTAKLLNRIFPKMQGINLLAYIWQTIAEATSGRTSLEDALSRFDQTMNIHGVKPPKPKIPTIKPDEPKPKPVEVEEEKKPSRVDSKSSRIFRDYVVKDSRSETRVAPKPIEAKAPAGRAETIPVVDKKDGEAPANTAESIHALQDQQTDFGVVGRNIPEETASVSQNITKPGKILSVKGQGGKEELQEVEPVKEEIAAVIEESKEEEIIPVDDVIAERIAAFEKALALKCPVCKTGVLQEKSTAAGKVFYACESEGCNFISWGRPHNLECKRCKNPFLVEVTDSSGQTILRCPRATCQYRQALNAGAIGTPGGVKVVRKRLVRRKI
jgi:ssDNA-binding Zn-finger/Zn-ribbon topoisomerase 1